jgi:hypothetical protein
LEKVYYKNIEIQLIIRKTADTLFKKFVPVGYLYIIFLFQIVNACFMSAMF